MVVDTGRREAVSSDINCRIVETNDGFDVYVGTASVPVRMGQEDLLQVVTDRSGRKWWFGGYKPFREPDQTVRGFWWRCAVALWLVVFGRQGMRWWDVWGFGFGWRGRGWPIRAGTT